MSFSHSFAPEFYQGYEDENLNYPVNCPCTVYQALMSIPDRRWNRMCKEIFNCHPDFVDIETVMQKIIETDTVSNLTVPVTVWIDEDGFYTVDVWDKPTD